MPIEFNLLLMKCKRIPISHRLGYGLLAPKADKNRASRNTNKGQRRIGKTAAVVLTHGSMMYKGYRRHMSNADAIHSKCPSYRRRPVPSVDKLQCKWRSKGTKQGHKNAHLPLTQTETTTHGTIWIPTVLAVPTTLLAIASRLMCFICSSVAFIFAIS